MSVYSEMDRETDNRMIDRLVYKRKGGIKRGKKRDKEEKRKDL